MSNQVDNKLCLDMESEDKNDLVFVWKIFAFDSKNIKSKKMPYNAWQKPLTNTKVCSWRQMSHQFCNSYVQSK